MNVPGRFSLDVTPVPSLSSIEMKPDVDPTEPKPSSVSGPSTLDSVPGPSDFETAIGKSTVIFNLLLGLLYLSAFLHLCLISIMLLT